MLAGHRDTVVEIGTVPPDSGRLTSMQQGWLCRPPLKRKVLPYYQPMVYITFYPYQGSLTYDKVKAITWGVGDESATVKSVLRQISITFPRQE